MEKKLTAQGPKDRKSYTVTLPIEWVKKEGLDKRRQVELNIVGNKVVISPRKGAGERVLIDGDDYASSLIRVLQGIYRSGVDETKLRFKNSKILEETSDIIEQKLIGYEIVEHKKDYLIIKDITKESEEEFKTVFRRLFLLLLELSESEDAVQIKIVDKNIKRLINYCQRILIKRGHSEFLKTPLYYLMLDRLEKIGDEFKWLSCVKITKKKDKDYLKEIRGIMRTAYETFYKFDAKKYNAVVRKSYNLKNEIKLGEKVDRATIHLHNLARIINSLYGDIFTLRFKD
ncbi:AbrB/MazE/SpoVT family DNA-binding domain-containing protein [Candidatus Woesearchaeota archaeon]|nr:AbrB/MazE/SpoVT family DNA-binding domain-containing protein [Candidatus Woesearchaeota archaeon]